MSLSGRLPTQIARTSSHGSSKRWLGEFGDKARRMARAAMGSGKSVSNTPGTNKVQSLKRSGSTINGRYCQMKFGTIDKNQIDEKHGGLQPAEDVGGG